MGPEAAETPGRGFRLSKGGSGPPQPRTQGRKGLGKGVGKAGITGVSLGASILGGNGPLTALWNWPEETPPHSRLDLV